MGAPLAHNGGGPAAAVDCAERELAASQMGQEVAGMQEQSQPSLGQVEEYPG